MIKQFLQIELKDSQQEASQINLQNLVEMLKDPDFRQRCKQCQSDFEFIEIFPLVGFGISVTKTKKNSKSKIKVVQFSNTLKIIDLSFLDLKNVIKQNQNCNCILPLLPQEEGNSELLNSEAFKRKISYLVHQKLDSYQEDTYLQLIQASVRCIMIQGGDQSWGKDILNLAFQTCMQVFTNTPLFCNQISSLQFQKSKFQLLNLFCLFEMGQLSKEDILYYINLNSQNNQWQTNENNIQIFFDQLKFEGLDQMMNNIHLFMEKYLEKNNYFLLKFTQKKIIQGLINYMIPQEEQWKHIQNQKFIQQKKEQQKLLKYYTISTIYKTLLQNLFKDYNNEKKINYFYSFSQHFNQDGDDNKSYQNFLMEHSQYHDIYEIYQLYIQITNDFLNDYDDIYFQEKYKAVAITFIMKQISNEELKKSKAINISQLVNEQEIQKVHCLLSIFQKIFNFYDQITKEIQDKIFYEITSLTWLNYLQSRYNFKEEEQIRQFLNNFLVHLKTLELTLDQEQYSKVLYDYSRFTFLLLKRTKNLTQSQHLSFNLYQEIKVKEESKEHYCYKIYNVSRKFKI